MIVVLQTFCSYVRLLCVARDKEERDSWVAALEDTIDYHAQPVKVNTSNHSMTHG